MTTEHYDPSLLTFIQSRAEANQEVIDEYAQMYRDGVSFDPAQAISDGKRVYVWDGYHRGEAARKAGMLLFLSIKPGTREEAEWLALSANQRHGLRRSNEDKQKAVRLALQHPKGAQMSDRAIANHCGVSNTFVGKIRAELEASGNRFQIDGEASVNGLQIETRTVTRGAQVYEINTANIGVRPPSVPPAGGEAPPQSPPQGGEVRPPVPPGSWSLYEKTDGGSPYAETLCPNCDEKKIIIFPRLNQVTCENCHRVWKTILSYHTERLAKLEGEDRPPSIPPAGGEVRPSSMADLLGSDIAGNQVKLSPNEAEAPAGEFDCPYCGLEKVVHVNGGAWCLNCDRRWPSPEAFKKELANYELQRLYLDIMQQFSQIARAASVEELRVIQAWLDNFSQQKEHTHETTP